MTVVKFYRFHPSNPEVPEEEIQKYLNENPSMSVSHMALSTSQYHAICAVTYTGVDQKTRDAIANTMKNSKVKHWEPWEEEGFTFA